MEQISRIVVDRNDDGEIIDVTFFFADATNPNEPFGLSEFVQGTETRRWLEEIEFLIRARDGNLANLSDLESGDTVGSMPTVPTNLCHSDRDGECNWKDCPQIRDKEPETTGRHCPLDNWPEED